MQIWHLDEWLMLVLFFVLWFLFQAGAGFVCVRLPDSFFSRDNWLYKTRGWEQDGEIYDKWFRIRRWKGYLPDGGALFKSKGYRKKHMKDFSQQNLDRYLLESRRAELTHWLAILPFWVFGLFAPFSVVPIMLLYALAINLPCIMAQRYNRPRVAALLAKKRTRMPKKAGIA